MKIRLATKMLLSIVAIQAAMLVIIVWNSVRTINVSHMQILQQTVKEEGELLANALLPGLAAQDLAMLNDTLSLLRKNPGYVYARVYDYKGQLLANIEQSPPAISGVQAGAIPQQSDVGQIFSISEDIHLAGQLLGTLRAGYSLNEVTKVTTAARFQNTSIAAIALVLSILATSLITLYLNRRMGRLRKGVSIFTRGNLGHRIRLPGTDELSDLADQFNEMAITLHSAHQELQDINKALVTESSHLQTLMNGVNAIVFEATADGSRFLYVSDEAENIVGYPAEHWKTPDFWFSHCHPEDVGKLKEKIFEYAARDNITYTHDFRMRHYNERYVWTRCINTVDRDTGGKPIIRGLILDVSEEKKAEEHIMYLAEHDSLTGLLNRRRFQEELAHYIALAKRYDYEGALLFIDLDQFKYINDTLGHHGGDEFLVAISRCLENNLRDTDVLGRLGGDEFAIILARATEPEMEQVAQKIIETLGAQVFVAQEIRTQTSASIGISIFPRHSDKVDELLAKADAAMYGVKARGRNNYFIYDESEQQLLAMREKVHWEDRIRRALKNDHFRLYYQPIVDIRSGEVAHHEVLLRMLDVETDEPILPGAFLDTAERFGLIREIDMWVVDRSIRHLAEGPGAVRQTGLGINLSGRNFTDPELLVHIQRCIEKYGADPEKIIFEVTETAAVENIFQAREFIQSLKGVGCRFSMDDFGVGFSSLHYLRNLPVDFIKIDGSFIRNIDTDETDQFMVSAITSIARGLGIRTVAECVETRNIYDRVCEVGVDLVQGYYLGRPAPERQPDIPAAVRSKSQ